VQHHLSHLRGTTYGADWALFASSKLATDHAREYADRLQNVAGPRMLEQGVLENISAVLVSQHQASGTTLHREASVEHDHIFKRLLQVLLRASIPQREEEVSQQIPQHGRRASGSAESETNRGRFEEESHGSFAKHVRTTGQGYSYIYISKHYTKHMNAPTHASLRS